MKYGIICLELDQDSWKGRSIKKAWWFEVNYNGLKQGGQGFKNTTHTKLVVFDTCGEANDYAMDQIHNPHAIVPMIPGDYGGGTIKARTVFPEWFEGR
jgi:hypothetical protein